MPRLTSAPVLASGFVLVTALAVGPLIGVDVALNEPWWATWREPKRELAAVERLGQRAVCLPILFLVAALYARRTRSWQPLLLATGSVLVLNLVVGSLKLLTDRGHPRIADPSFFADGIEGIMYPSGHAANAILVYGLAVYFVWRYGRVGRRTIGALTALVGVIAVSMVAVGLYFQWHWFSDLVAGFLIGGLVLRLTVTVHRWLQRPQRGVAGDRRRQPVEARA